MLREIQSCKRAKNSWALVRVMRQGNVPNSADFLVSFIKFIQFFMCLVVSSSGLPFIMSSWF